MADNHHQHHQQRQLHHEHNYLQMRVNGAGAVAAGNLYGTYRRGDSICSTDSGVSMMTMDYSSSTGGGGGDYSHHHHPHSHAQQHQQHRNNIELVGTIRRSLTTAEQGWSALLVFLLSLLFAVALFLARLDLRVMRII